MNIDNISSINCLKRNKYDKKFCYKLNPDKINDFKNHIDAFDKNIFSLENKSHIIKDISKEGCMEYCIDNKDEGFTYQGNKNKCFLFNSGDLNERISEDYNKYNIKSYIKTKDIIDIDRFEDQINSNNHFEETNNYNFMYNGLINNGLINNVDIIDKNKCMDACIRDYDNCKSIVYMEEPKECTFYKNKVMNNKDKNIDFKNNDIYTVKNKKIKEIDENNNILLNEINNLTEDDLLNKYYCKIQNDKCELDYKIRVTKNEEKIIEENTNDTIPLFDCAGMYSTNPFCTKEYDPDDTEYIKNEELSKLMNYTDCENISKIDNVYKQQKIFNNACRMKYGNEYIFDNNVFDTESIIKCEDGGIKAKCKVSFDNKNIIIDNFDNKLSYKKSNLNSNKNISCIIIFLIIIIIFFIIVYF